MKPKKFYFIMLGIFGMSLVSGATMLYLTDKLLGKRSENVVSLKLESRMLDEQQTAYNAAKKDVEKYKYLKEIISSALPQDKDQARSVREIFALATDSGITLKSIQFPSSTLGAATSTKSSSATTAVIPVTQAKVVDGLKGVYSIEAVVVPNSDGKVYKVTYEQLIDFLEKIENNRRAMQVASLQLTPQGETTSDNISFTLTLNIFIKP